MITIQYNKNNDNRCSSFILYFNRYYNIQDIKLYSESELIIINITIKLILIYYYYLNFRQVLYFARIEFAAIITLH